MTTITGGHTKDSHFIPLFSSALTMLFYTRPWTGHRQVPKIMFHSLLCVLCGVLPLESFKTGNFSPMTIGEMRCMLEKDFAAFKL